MEYTAAKRVNLRTDAVYNEKWLQKIIADDPSVLGLGELAVRDAERSQPRAGRLDLLLSDPATGTRYEVEIQLGATDESHIIRTIEYWDIERARYPQYDHVAVLIAEDITSRFLNVIALFNKAIPIVAIQIAALSVGGHLTLHATRVLDLMRRGTDEEDEPGPPADRSYWEARASAAALKVLDSLEELIRDVTGDAVLSLKFNKSHIGLARHGIADNFMLFYPRKSGKVLTTFRIDHSDELDMRLEDAGLDVATGFKARQDRYYIRLTSEEVVEHREVLQDLIRMAADADAEGS